MVSTLLERGWEVQGSDSEVLGASALQGCVLNLSQTMTEDPQTTLNADPEFPNKNVCLDPSLKQKLFFVKRTG